MYFVKNAWKAKLDKFMQWKTLQKSTSHRTSHKLSQSIWQMTEHCTAILFACEGKCDAPPCSATSGSGNQQLGSEGAERWNLLLQQPHPLSPRAALDDQKVKAEASIQTYLTPLGFSEWKKS